MDEVRIGIAGFGGMGEHHAKDFLQNKVPNGRLISVYDVNKERLIYAKEHYGDFVKTYDDLEEFLDSGIDGVIVATIHYYHPEIAISAFKKGLHVLIEKPAGVFTKQVKEMNKWAKESGKVFAIMYNQRTNPYFKKIREIVLKGDLGEIKRITWIATNWYRPQSYYDMNDWRGTWKGEGGGILLNQGIHQLDIWQWIFGLPKRLRAFLGLGKYHNIEVEDEAVLYMEYENRAIGIFVTGTGEAPGENRLEIVGDKGKLVYEDDKLTFFNLEIPESTFRVTEKNPYAKPNFKIEEIVLNEENPQHTGILRNWVNAILYGEPLIAPGEEGLNALMITNGAYLSHFLDNWIYLPIDDDLYIEKFNLISS